MSVTLMAAVWPLPLSTTDKVVLLALADAANDEGVTWIPLRSQKGKLDILTKTSLGERAIQGAIKRLTEAGHLSRVERPGKGCIYTVYPTPAADAPRTGCAPQEKTETPAPAAGKPSVTIKPPSAKASGGKRASKSKEIVEADLPDWVPVADWEAFMEVRREMERGPKKIPFTAEARKRLIETLTEAHNLGHDVGLMLRKSIVNGYRGVFIPDGPPPKPAANSNGALKTDEERAASLERTAEGMEKMGRFSDATELRQTAARIRAGPA